jgi:hypothetical protein
MYTIPPALRPRFERSAAHVYSLGPRAVAEAFAEIALRTDGLQGALAVLDRYKDATPKLLAAVGGDRLPLRPLRLVARV